jgi:hypothetical protein
MEVSAMSNANDEILAELNREWPGWECWVVHRVVGGDRWCARRRDDQRRLLHADTPEQLTEYLEEAVQP